MQRSTFRPVTHASSRNPNSEPRKPLFRRCGFTLIEILIVVVIAALAATIALPGFVRAMRGSELRTASRTVLMAHKYARSTSVLRQVPMAILLDKNNRELEIITVAAPPGADARSKFLDDRTARSAGLATGDDQAVPTIQTELVRKLGKEIEVALFKSERGGQEFQGVYWINYHPNGMSDGFELVLTDGHNRKVEIASDAISGRVEAEFDRF